MAIEYYILSLKYSGLRQIIWWCPNQAGYVADLDRAGLYSAEEVSAERERLDNLRTTVAVPAEAARALSCRVVLPVELGALLDAAARARAEAA